MAQNLTDAELDRDWQPNGRRPQSTIARSFSQELMDIFRIENSVADMDEKVDQRKQNVQSQAAELEALERRIREMEERMKRGSSSTHQRGALPIHQQQPSTSTSTSTSATTSSSAAATATKDGSRSRPGTARQNQPPAPSSANMPPTPTASEGDYEFVGRDDLSDRPPSQSTRH
ncbi:hypothetical protein VD0002_g857 [Verticillium dahliae]|uniref:Uncharacterized protein n=2 Tax=Verticillium dahliae TaxID=27337 RepID=G2XBL7_VERDV|nr:uncharacterized protein VDAG_07549 [Verticillium dahliae VdLs.17]KAF3349564.1 hypothetical protein VdG2_02410 [Verticillium dahliae VDG2]KAH6699324.1 hypothetical protein EV126DRAFT_401236 [Verticillium dahliae]EGY16385.1 hypothetical protein VDAG_07549 [Verticillium dahliae VdLs.17]PNH32681.1 hypothetical protein BJF96_g4070 [Verticillium dahliae]PNH57809.1 hypothetical protein VD0003_g55 [Verticillium dahliae]